MAEDKIGFGKTPEHTKFKKGNREWQKRKKAGPLDVGRLFERVMSGQSVKSRRGKRRTRSEELVQNYIAAALQCDLAGADALITLRTDPEAPLEERRIILVFEEEDRDA